MVLLCSILFPQLVYAQADDGVRIQQLRVQVMPEFDDPRVLVIVQGRLAIEPTALPTSLTVRIPRGAQINQMAEMDMSTGATIAKAYDAQPDPVDERWTLVTYELTNAHIFYEFYYTPIEGSPDKVFRYAFSTLQVADDVLLEVQQPRTATNFSLEPPATVARFDEKLELTYHQFNLGALPAGEVTEVVVKYTKTDPEPSISREQLMAMQMGPVVPETSAPDMGNAETPASLPTWLLVLMGGAILVGVGRYVWVNQTGHGGARPVVPAQSLIVPQLEIVPQSEMVPQPQSDIQASPEPEVPLEPKIVAQSQEGKVQGGFCTQCGTALKPGARFCHFCGAQKEG
jgi:hypothetical protein